MALRRSYPSIAPIVGSHLLNPSVEIEGGVEALKRCLSSLPYTLIIYHDCMNKWLLSKYIFNCMIMKWAYSS